LNGRRSVAITSSMIGIFDRYVLKLLTAATFIIALALTLIILLTQSLRYLELVIGSDASAIYFLIMTGLAIPKFLEVILPIAFVIACAYQANKLIHDREIIVMHASGVSLFRYARGFLIFTGLMMILQFALSGWIAPLSVNELQKTRDDVKSHYATLMFREGVFNDLGNGMTAFVEDRVGLNELIHLVIHDENGTIERDTVTTIIAQRGIVNINDGAQQILIYNGTQYQKKDGQKSVSRLDFDQYILDIPTNNGTITTRWREPDERTFDELFISSENASSRDLNKAPEFIAEIHKRVTTPLLYLVFTGLIFVFLFLQDWKRDGQSQSAVKIAGIVMIVQALHIIVNNQAQDNVWMNIGLYCITLLPLFIIGFVIRAYYRQ